MPMDAKHIVLWMASCAITAALAMQVSGAEVIGKISYGPATAAPGTIVYTLGVGQNLMIHNNIIASADHLPRGITDKAGAFCITGMNRIPGGVFARDYNNRVAYVPHLDANEPLDLTLGEPARVTVTYTQAGQAVAGTKVTAIMNAARCDFRCTYSATTDDNGRASFDEVIPGQYRFAVREEIPPIGCCLHNVEVKGRRVTLLAGEHRELQFGRTDLATLSGKVTDTQGQALHGVWVRLLPVDPNDPQASLCGVEPTGIWADITQRDGSYTIYDIPAGPYTMTCYRRLALNNACRTLHHEQTLQIKAIPEEKSREIPPTQTCDITVDVSPFEPLEYGQDAPALAGTLLSGQPFDLAEQRGRIVVIHFYISCGCVCPASTPTFDRVQEKFPDNQVIVLGVCLDRQRSTFETFVAEKSLEHRQLYAGPWQDSRIAKDFRVASVPSSIIIDAEGKVAQQDLFQDVLIQFLHELVAASKP